MKQLFWSVKYWLRKILGREETLILTFNKEFSDLLHRMGQKLGNLPPSQVLRQSLALYKFCKTEVEKGNRIVLRNDKGESVKEIVF